MAEGNTRNGALAILVKTPGYSPVKTRRATERGRLYAEGWYRRAAATVAAVAAAAQARYGIHVYWAVAEPDALDAWPGLPVLAQGDGDLGERMARVHMQLVARHGFGLLLGADTPQLSVDLLGAAVAWLDHSAPRLLIGPARDGGFWLFGGNRAPPMAAWTAVRYSNPETARDLQTSMQDSGAWHQLATLNDVDHADDLDAVLHALLALSNPLPEQRALAAWMRDHEAVLP
ncbi:MAG TPA: DUF2064 domain-containing protein [Xanthomonadaceae bacterium]|nr:DUF2064 domain-containing protein [Xanthomonadaceae bacterium]